jgi:hypothetical protein
MIQDGKVVCDSCHVVISRVSNVPPEGWPKMHNLCSSCFRELGKASVARG